MDKKPEIHFFYEECGDFTLQHPSKTANWLTQIIDAEKLLLVSINYIFCNDDYLHNINLEYLHHDSYTDIITFDHSDKHNSIEGDIYISIDRIHDNANTLNTPFFDELHRVIIHGILHLFGFNDKTKDEKIEMRKKEEACLSLYPT